MSNASFINDAIAKAVLVADRKTSEAASFAQQAIDAATVFIDFGSGEVSFIPKVTLAKVDTADLKLPEGLDDITGLPSLIDELSGDLANKYAQFFVDFFPNDTDVLSLALGRMHDTLTDGGSILPLEQEDQVWQRDRDRVLTDSDRNERELIGGWAARGFPLPPGAAIAAQQMLRNEATVKIAGSSRDRAIQRIEVMVENVKFAIKETIEFRVRAIAAAGDYIRALSLGPQLAAQLMATQVNARARAAEVIAQYFTAKVNAAAEYNRAQVSLESLRYDPIKGSADNRVRLNIAFGDTAARISQARSQAALGAATAAGNQGTAALSQLTAILSSESIENAA